MNCIDEFQIINRPCIQDKFHLVVVYYPFYMFLNLICQCFVKDFFVAMCYLYTNFLVIFLSGFSNGVMLTS